jgi:uncharacterized damage-inducible protein DinB
MTIAEVRELFAYGEWANGRMFAAAEGLAPEQLEAPVTSSFPSVRGTLGHIVLVERAWLRWLGDAEDDAGEAHADPLAPLIRHVVNHSTHHRGQAATQLRQLGQAPPGTDLVAYSRLGQR